MRDRAKQVYINTRVGTDYSLTGTATGTGTGMAFAAHLTEAEVRQAIALEEAEPKAWRRVGRVRWWERVAEDFARNREKSFATIHPNPAAGITAIASPVLDHAGQVRMVMTMIGIESNPELKPGSAAREALLTITGRMSCELGLPIRPRFRIENAAPEGPRGKGPTGKSGQSPRRTSTDLTLV